MSAASVTKDPLGALWQALEHLLSREAHALLLGAVVAGVVGLGLGVWGPSRRWLGKVAHELLLRLAWRRATAHAGLQTRHGRLPKIRRATTVTVGDQLQVAIPPGRHAGDLERLAPELATCLHVREVRVTREVTNAARATVTLVRRDPLAESASIAWPWLGADSVELASPIPVGLDELGEWVNVQLLWHNLLVGGEPGGGKSVAVNVMVAAAALDPRVRLTLLDGKLVELALWRPLAESCVGVSVADAIDVLRGLVTEMDERYAALLEAGRRKVVPGDDLDLHVVCVDELAHYLTSGDRKSQTEFAALLRDLVSRGRAAGVIVLAATQKPSSDVIPTSLRDLFGFRWAFRCATSQASDTILGSGWGSRGYSAASIDAAHRGVGYLLHEGGTPVRLRSCLIEDEDLVAIAERAKVLRAAREAVTP